MADAPQGDFLVLSQISKRYGGVRALENVDFRCGRGRSMRFSAKTAPASRP